MLPRDLARCVGSFLGLARLTDEGYRRYTMNREFKKRFRYRASENSARLVWYIDNRVKELVCWKYLRWCIPGERVAHRFWDILSPGVVLSKKWVDVRKLLEFDPRFGLRSASFNRVRGNTYWRLNNCMRMKMQILDSVFSQEDLYYAKHYPDLVRKLTWILAY